jgi:hypothetical protein
VDQLQAELTAKQINEWQEYWAEEPFGQIRQDHLFGTLIALISNRFNFEENPKAVGILDVLPKYGEGEPEEDDLQAAVQSDLQYIEAMIQSGQIVDLRGQS